MKGVCPLCGEYRRLEGHHPTGRRRSLPIHPDLVFFICWVCNTAQNLLWDREGVGRDVTLTAGVVARRLAMWIDLWADRPTTAEQARAIACAVAALPMLRFAA
jgi:hypothetical protein